MEVKEKGISNSKCKVRPEKEKVSNRDFTVEKNSVRKESKENSIPRRAWR